jgi:hypothetical protein
MVRGPRRLRQLASQLLAELRAPPSCAGSRRPAPAHPPSCMSGLGTAPSCAPTRLPRRLRRSSLHRALYLGNFAAAALLLQGEASLDATDCQVRPLRCLAQPPWPGPGRPRDCKLPPPAPARWACSVHCPAHLQLPIPPARRCRRGASRWTCSRRRSGRSAASPSATPTTCCTAGAAAPTTNWAQVRAAGPSARGPCCLAAGSAHASPAAAAASLFPARAAAAAGLFSARAAAAASLFQPGRVDRRLLRPARHPPTHPRPRRLYGAPRQRGAGGHAAGPAGAAAGGLQVPHRSGVR